VAKTIAYSCDSRRCGNRCENGDDGWHEWTWRVLLEGQEVEATVHFCSLGCFKAYMDNSGFVACNDGEKHWQTWVWDALDTNCRMRERDRWYTENEYDVVLLEVGPNRIQVMKAVRDLTGAGLRETKEMVENTPSKIIEAAQLVQAGMAVHRIAAQGGIATLLTYPMRWTAVTRDDLPIAYA